MPTKLNKAGQQQEYVPAGNGDASGEYGNDTGSNKHFQSFHKKNFQSFSTPKTESQPIKTYKTVDDFRNTILSNKQAKMKERNGQQYDNINLDLSKPIHKIDENDRLKHRTDKNAEGYDIAERLIKKYEPHVDNIANDILGITEQQGGIMVGLDFRLKRPDSLTRKLYAEVNEAKEKDNKIITLQEAADKMGDIARFTSCFEPENFQKGADAVIRKLQADGYELVKFKNYFQPGASYKGLNCNFRDKNGNIFELQFHTPETMKIKEGYEISVKNRKALMNNLAFHSHDIYETTRVIEDKERLGTATPEETNFKKMLNDYSVKEWDKIKYNFPNWKIEQYQQASKPQTNLQVGKIKTYKPVGRTANGEIVELGTEVRAKTLHNGLLMETKKNPRESFYGGSKGNYKIIDEETGTLVGFAKDYEDAIKYSQNQEWLDRIKRAKEVFFKRHPHLKKGTQ